VRNAAGKNLTNLTKEMHIKQHNNNVIV